MDVLNWLQKQGYSTVQSSYYTHIDTWRDWYCGKVDKFHSYNIYNGVKQIGCKRYSLGMPKMVCEDWANLILNEKVAISADGYDGLSERLNQNNFWVRGNQLIELAFALGTGAFVEYLGANEEPLIDYVRASMIFPLSWDNGEIMECAFASQRKIGKTKALYIQRHVMENGEYTIINDYVDEETGADLGLPKGVKKEIRTRRDKPLFQIITPNIVNNVDFDCPMGISVFANAIDAIKQCDLAFDSYCNEFVLGRKRIIVSADFAANKAEEEAGTAFPIFDARDTVFYGLQSDDENKNTIKEIDMHIRAQEHEEGLQRGISTVSGKCGLGTARYRFEALNAQTATAVISAQSELYQNLCKHETIVRKAIEDMVWTLAFLDGVSPKSVEINFDDSIITDKEAEFNRMLQLVASGAAHPWELRMSWLNETEEQAKKNTPTSSDLME